VFYYESVAIFLLKICSDSFLLDDEENGITDKIITADLVYIYMPAQDRLTAPSSCRLGWNYPGKVGESLFFPVFWRPSETDIDCPSVCLAMENPAQGHKDGLLA
jgi:hypothetical protein